MSNNLVMRARGGGSGLDRNMDSLIDNLRHRFAAASQSNPNSTPLSQAMLFQAMNNQHLNSKNSTNLQERIHHPSGQVVASRQARANSPARLNQRSQAEAQVSRCAPQAVSQRAQCAPLDLSVRTNNSTGGHSGSRSRLASGQGRSLGQRRHQQQQHQQQEQHQQQHQLQQQNLSLDMLKTIAQVIIREKSGLSQPQAKLDQVSSLSQHQLNHSELVNHQTNQLISSSASPVSDYNDQSPERMGCHLISSGNHANNHNGDQVGRPSEIEIARRLTAAAAAAAVASTTANQTDVISSTNGRRSRRQSANTKRQKANKSHLCNHCGRSFVRSDMLTRHSRLHSGHKPYQCGKCLQVFSRSDHLSTHERTHTGEKPYQCGICAYSACRRDMITRHMRTHLGQRVKHRPSADDSTRAEAVGGQVEGCDAGGELETNYGSNGANSNETNSNAQSPSSIATTILMADEDEDDREDDDDDDHDEEDGRTKGEITSFLYNATTRAYN